jgi:PAS domain S-box-containing protein
VEREAPGPTEKRAGGHAAATHAPVAAVGERVRAFTEQALVGAFVKDHKGRYVYTNPDMFALFGVHPRSDWRGKTDADIWPHDLAAVLAADDQAVIEQGAFRAFRQAIPLSDGLHTFLVMKFPLPSERGRIDVAGVGLDITKQARTEAERDRLAAAIEQVAESVIVTDRDGSITYVNTAFERVTGYRRNEVIGQNPRFLKSGLQTPWFYDAMWAAITNGLPWMADIVNRRKDGSLFTEEAVISPIREASGAITGFMAVKRDVTEERALVQRSSQLARQRTLIAEMIRGLRAADTPEATAQAICRQVVTFTGVKAAHISLFELNGSTSLIGFVVGGRPDPLLEKVSPRHSQRLRDRSGDGPWIEPWVKLPGYAYSELLSGLGVHSVAYAPVRTDRQLIGLLVVHAEGSVEEVSVAEVLPALVEFADLAGALIGRDVAQRTEVGRGRDRLSSVIHRGAFHPVFQPIVNLEGDTIVGYEALTRFADAGDPEPLFAMAAAVGLGIDLETATLRAALAAAEDLPRSTWLNVNASPDLILAREPLHALLKGGRGRRLVLEVTEHIAIADYAAFRVAMAALGPKVEFAVDDAGVGFSSLRHILELRPAFVKLDRSLVAGLESDPARQAMIVGLRHFALATGCRLIAEGVETEAELSVLRTLEIGLGQGYLLGRPLPVEEVCRPGDDHSRPEDPGKP